MAAFKCIIVVAACLSVALAYSTGAPQDACANLTPQHGPVEPQKSAVPYTITAVDKATRGQTVKVTIRGNNADDKILGFLIQARDGQTPVGTFKVVDQLNSQLLSCGSKGVRHFIFEIK